MNPQDPEPFPAKGRRTRWPWTLLRWSVTLGVCGWLLQKLDWASVQTALSRADARWIAATIGAMFAGHVVYAEAARWLLKATDANVPRPRLIANHFLGLFFSMFLPSGVGGDVVRVFDLSRGFRSIPLSAAASIILIQRLLGLTAALELIVAVMPWAAPKNTLTAAWISGAVLCGMCAIGGVLAFGLVGKSSLREAGKPAPRKLGMVLKHGRFFLEESRGRRILIVAGLLVLASQVLLVMASYCVGRSLGIEISPAHFFYIAPLAAVAVTAPVSINGLGVREAIYIYYLGAVGVANADAAAIGIELFLLNTLFAALGGLAWLFPGKPQGEPAPPPVPRVSDLSTSPELVRIP